MRATSIISVFSLVLGNLLFVSSANAQQIVKRVRCADYTNSASSLDVYRNTANITRIVSFQVVKDGCRPKLIDGSYRVDVEGSLPSSRVLVRHGKFTQLLDVPVADNGRAVVYFSPNTIGARVTGTFDYMLTVD